MEGQDADGATMEGEGFEVRSAGWSTAVQTSEQAAAAVLRTEAFAADRGHRVHSIGVTWSDDADTEASLLLKSLSDSGFDNIVPVRLSEATDALARGIAEVTGYRPPPSASSNLNSSSRWSFRTTKVRCRPRSITPS